jgi:hypothetical protein
MALLSTSIFFNLKSTPIEFIKFWLNWFSVYRKIMQDFPTPESPSNKILNRKSLLNYYSILLVGIHFILDNKCLLSNID